MSDRSNYSDQSNYGYTPSLGWAVAFIVLFSVSALVHSVQAYKGKYWVVYPTLVLGAIIEILGWSARLWSNRNVLYVPPFLMQICTLIMAPVFFSAYDYFVLGIAINKLGPQYSVLRPSWYFIVFITADIVSLILQAVGGGQAASSAADSAPTDTATNIMVAGIIFQLVSMGIFVILGVDFTLRAQSRRPYAFRERQIEAQKQKAARRQANEDVVLAPTTAEKPSTPPEHGSETGEQIEARQNLTKWWIMLTGCLVSSIAIVVRGIYRSIELSQGWDSKIVQTEILQNVLDGLMMVIAVGIFNFINPLYLLPRRTSWKGFH